MTMAYRLWLFSWLLATQTWAQSPTTWGLKWKAPPECIQAAELAERVERKEGRPLFSGQAPRHIEGYVSQATPGWRVRLTLLDDAGRVLGTRDVASEAKDCRLIDERLVLMLTLLIAPFQDAPLADALPAPPMPSPPPPPKLFPAPRVARLEVRGPRRLLNGRYIVQEHFYQKLGRTDLVDAMRARQRVRAGLFITGGVSTAASVGLFIAAIAGAGCTKFQGTPLFPGACLEYPPGWFAAAISAGAVALGSFLWAGLFNSRPTTQEEDTEFAAQFNQAQSLASQVPKEGVVQQEGQ